MTILEVDGVVCMRMAFGFVGVSKGSEEVDWDKRPKLREVWFGAVLRGVLNTLSMVNSIYTAVSSWNFRLDLASVCIQ